MKQFLDLLKAPAVSIQTTSQAGASFGLGHADSEAQGKTALNPLARKLPSMDCDKGVTLGHTNWVDRAAFHQTLSEQHATVVHVQHSWSLPQPQRPTRTLQAIHCAKRLKNQPSN